jgi:hypothetical protein
MDLGNKKGGVPMPGIGPAGNAPDYDALVKADPASLYPVSPDISYLCQIAMDY